METKICTKCNINLPITNFYKLGGKKIGYRGECKICTSKSNNDYVKKNKRKVYDYRNKWTKENREKVYKSRIKMLYNLTDIEYNNLLQQQNNSCKLCLKKEKLCVDHCHETGKVRGLLCHNCNKALGLLKDNLNTLLNAIEYIKNA